MRFNFFAVTILCGLVGGVYSSFLAGVDGHLLQSWGSTGALIGFGIMILGMLSEIITRPRKRTAA